MWRDHSNPCDFTGLNRGPKIIVMGAVHGNETCGPNAILRAIADCRSGRLPIRRGQVTFVPVGEPEGLSPGDAGRGSQSQSGFARENDPGGLRGQDRQSDLRDAAGARRPARHPLVQRRRRSVHLRGPSGQSGRGRAVSLRESRREFAARLGTATVIHGWLDVYGRFLAERERLGFPTGRSPKGLGLPNICGSQVVTA